MRKLNIKVPHRIKELSLKITPKVLTMIGTIVIVSFIGFGIFSIASANHKLKAREYQLRSTSSQLTNLESKYQTLNSALGKAKADKATTQQQLNDLQTQKDQLDQQKAALEAQLQAKANEEAAAAAKVASAAKLSLTASASADQGCGDNSYADYIYQHESGCSTVSTNSGGCYGLGQDCNGVVRSKCGSDYACENAYFSDYASRRYGGWAEAYAFWVNHHWW